MNLANQSTPFCVLRMSFVAGKIEWVPSVVSDVSIHSQKKMKMDFSDFVLKKDLFSKYTDGVFLAGKKLKSFSLWN